MTTNNNFPLFPFLFSLLIALSFTACPPDTPSKNQPLTANAGTDQTHTLAQNLTITLNGTDSAGNIASYLWQCETYTANQGTVSAEYTAAQVNALITNADTATATVAPRKAGTYVFKLTVTDNDGESDTDNVTVVVEARIATQQVTVAAVPFSVGQVLNLQTASNNYVFTDPNNVDLAFSSNDLAGITYQLTSTSPSKSWEDLRTYVNANGQLSSSAYGNSIWPTITQTFYYNGQAVGSRTFIAEIGPTGNFIDIYDTTEDVMVSLPAVALTLEKEETQSVNYQ